MTDASDASRFCPECGSRLAMENLDDVASRVRHIEMNIRKDQRIVEIETAENISVKLTEKVKRYIFWASFPKGDSKRSFTHRY